MSKISPKLQKLLVGDAILNNLDRLADVLEDVKVRKLTTKEFFGDMICGFDQSLKHERTRILRDDFSIPSLIMFDAKAKNIQESCCSFCEFVRSDRNPTQPTK